jgi:hypothetical protein
MNICQLDNSIQLDLKEAAMRNNGVVIPTPEDNALEARAKASPNTNFHLHVGGPALSKVKVLADSMKLGAVEREAIRGWHLARILDEYADMHHIGKLSRVPSRKELQNNMKKGEAFWRGFQVARRVVILENGFRSPIENEEHGSVYRYAKSLDFDCALQGFWFGAPPQRGKEVWTFSDMIRRGDPIESEPSAYLQSVDRLICAIKDCDREHFMGSGF